MMYLVALLLVTVVSQKACGSPFHFPGELNINNDGEGAKLLQKFYAPPVAKALQIKTVPAVMSFEVIETDKNPSFMINKPEKFEKVGETGKTEPFILVIPENHVQIYGDDNGEISQEIRYLGGNYLMSEIETETSSNSNSNQVIKEDIHGIKASNTTKANHSYIETLAGNEKIEKAMTFNSDPTLHLISKRDAQYIVFPNQRSPVGPDPSEGSTLTLNSPASNPCRREGHIPYQGECNDILSSKPCGEGKWLVMKDYNYAVCEFRQCPMGTLFYLGTCVNLEDSTICAKGQMLYVESTGIAFCDCDADHIYVQRDGTCIAEYEQGWCPWGEYLVRNVDGNPECTPNPCGISGSVYHEKNRMCYKKNYVGFCKQEHIDIKGNEAECREVLFTDLRNIFEVPTLRRCPKGSKRDLLHECRRRFNMPSIPSVLKARHLYGGCPHGWTKAPGGKCKKIINLFAAPK